MSETLAAILDTRWGSTKFWLVVVSFFTFTLLLWFTKLSQDNYLLLAGGSLGAYLGANVVQHGIYAKQETAQVEADAVTQREKNADAAVTQRAEDKLNGPTS